MYFLNLKRLKAGLHVRRKHKPKHKPRVNRDDASTSARSFFLRLCLRRPGLHVAYACLRLCLVLASYVSPALKVLQLTIINDHYPPNTNPCAHNELTCQGTLPRIFCCWLFSPEIPCVKVSTGPQAWDRSLDELVFFQTPHMNSENQWAILAQN